MNQQAREALEMLAYNVAVVTVGRGGAEGGLTISWLTQVSFEPPIVAFAVDERHYSGDLLRSTRQCVINLLGEDQKALAAHFATQTMMKPSKLDPHPVRASAGGAAILEEAAAWIECDVLEVKPVGDHLLVLGAVVDGAISRPGHGLTTASGMRYRKSQPK